MFPEGGEHVGGSEGGCGRLRTEDCGILGPGPAGQRRRPGKGPGSRDVVPPVTRARSCWGTRWCTPHMSPLRSGLSPAAVLCFLAQVKCYHKKYRSATRDVIFRLQFHTGAVQGYGLVFGKEDLDSASKGETSRAPRWCGGGGCCCLVVSLSILPAASH